MILFASKQLKFVKLSTGNFKNFNNTPLCADIQVSVRRRLFDLLVPGFFPEQFYRVRRKVIKNKLISFLFLTHGNLSKQTVKREVKKREFLASTEIHTKTIILNIKRMIF